MPRTPGSRNKKFTIVENLQNKGIDSEELEKASVQAEEKFSNIQSMPDEEKLKNFLETYTVRNPRRGGSETVHKNKVDLPEYIQVLPEGKEKDKAIRAAAQAALLLGQPASQVSVQYGIPQSTVAQWEGVLITAGAVGRRDRLSDMLMVFIEQELKSLMAISIVTSEERWIRRQDAGNLAHYVAVKSDRLMQMLAAFGRVEETRRRYMEQLEVIEQNA